MKYGASSIMVGRKPRGENNHYKTAFVKIYNSDKDTFDPNIMPDEELDFENIKEVILKGFELKYLLEGNDLIVENLDEVNIEEDKENNTLTITK